MSIVYLKTLPSFNNVPNRTVQWKLLIMAQLYGKQMWLVSQSVSHWTLSLSVSMRFTVLVFRGTYILNTVTQTSLTFAVEIHVSQKMNLNFFGDPLTQVTASLENLTQ